MHTFTIKQEKNEFPIGILIFLLSPILSIVYILIRAYNGNYKNLSIMSLSIAIVSLLTPPFADLYRHTLRYFNYQLFSNELIQSNGSDYIFYTLANLFAQNNIPFEFISFIFVFTCYQISFFLFKVIIKSERAKTWSKKIRFMVFLCFLLIVPFIAILNGLRMATASYIALLGWFFFYQRKYVKGTLIYTIAILMHFASWLFLPVMLYTIFPVIKIKRNTFLIVFLILFLMGGILLNIIPKSFISTLDLESQVHGYMEESYERFGSIMSFNGFIAVFLERFVLVVTFFLIVFKKLNLNERTSSIVYFSIWLAALYFPYIVLFQRYGFFVVPLLVYNIINSNEGNMRNTQNIIKAIMISGVIMTMSYMYGYRAPLMATKYHKMFYPSIVTILQTDTHKNFEEALIPK